MMGTRMDLEVWEAIGAGETALKSLRQAQTYLNSARGWGILDLLGGGSIVGFVKHSKMNNAVNCINQAKWDLEQFQKELRDVYIDTDLQSEIGNFLMFADFFFDGIVADYLVQAKINEARSQVDSMIIRVEELLARMR